MTLSLEEFRASLMRADVQNSLGLPLSDAEAQRVSADPSSTQNWYSYWLASNPAPAAAASTPAAAAASAPADYQPTEVLQGAAPGAAGVYDAQQAPANGTPYPGYESQYAAGPAYPGYTSAPDATPQKKKRVGLWVALSVVGALILIAAIVVIAAFATARHWTKVDVPEQPETFHTEEYETGRYDVSMDTVNPCFVNQDWTDCIDVMAGIYNAACLDVELTPSGAAMCANYLSAIDEMRALDGDGYYVATLGTYGTLSRTAEISTREVSNDDYKPAQTHEAVCYFEFLGECE